MTTLVSLLPALGCAAMTVHCARRMRTNTCVPADHDEVAALRAEVTRLRHQLGSGGPPADAIAGTTR